VWDFAHFRMAIGQIANQTAADCNGTARRVAQRRNSRDPPIAVDRDMRAGPLFMGRCSTRVRGLWFVAEPPPAYALTRG
jgi:hypothetical protein